MKQYLAIFKRPEDNTYYSLEFDSPEEFKKALEKISDSLIHFLNVHNMKTKNVVDYVLNNKE